MPHPFVALPSTINIYQGAGTDLIDSEELASYLKTLVKQAVVQVHPEFFHFVLDAHDDDVKENSVHAIAVRLAGLKIRDVSTKDACAEPLQAEIDFEIKNLKRVSGKTCGLVYEGFKLQQLYSDFLPVEERDVHHLHLILTNQLFATWDENDLRYHARAGVFGFPSVISTAGIVEAPAKPRDYYLKKQLGEDVHALREEYGDCFIGYEDSRMTEVLKGYAAQALFYCLVGYPFCHDCNCRLYNAHRQSEVLQAQLLSPYEFCTEHQAVLDQINT
jgi:hypothetical protein